MRKLLPILLLLALTVSLLSGCGGEVLVFDGSLGLGISSAIGGDDASGDDKGEGEILHSVVSLIKSDDGKIQSIMIDEIEPHIAFSSSGAYLGSSGLISARSSSVKNEGGKTFKEEAEIFEMEAMGKTLDEIKSLIDKKEESGGLLSKGVTIDLDNFYPAIKRAYDSASVKVTGVMTAAIGLMSTAEGTDAKGSENGKATVKTGICAMAVMADKSCAGAISDESEVSFEYSSSGKNLTDMTRTLSTKRGLGDAYGMSKSSFDYDGDGRVLEWYKQADLFDESLRGLKRNVIERLSSSDGMGGEALIKSGCTIKIDSMTKCAALALSNVK